MVGTVKNVMANKFFGFIRGDGGLEYFFHREDYEGDWDVLVEDVKGRKPVEVSFEARNTPKGLRAALVTRE